MLILAGVSISAIVGDDGVLSKAQYATFINEMAAVEEAVQMWKVNEEESSIPADGLCQQNVLNEGERLAGEVGFYRVWNTTKTMPSTSVLSEADDFNSAFSSEMVFYPAGVQDLYYLNNEALGISKNKTYLIDAANGMIYSTAGIAIKGVRCYSSNMAKAVMNGQTTTPLFAEAEVSGTGSGEKLAGNVQSEFLEDGSENPNYNPNGFQIIASPTSNNIFKLYNNGDLYGKGEKGNELNTSLEEMNKINPYIWKEWNATEKIGAYKKIIPKANGMFIIDNNDDLWCYGNNSSSNMFGLTDEQIMDYNGKEVTKVQLNGKKVKKVFVGDDCAFLITTDNILMASGNNRNGKLGFGDETNRTGWYEVPDLLDIDKIENIYCGGYENTSTIIQYSDGRFYAAGAPGSSLGAGNKSVPIMYKFTRVWDGNLGPDIDDEIKKIHKTCQFVVLKKDGTLWVAGYSGYMMGEFTQGNSNEFRKYSLENVTNIYTMDQANLLIEVENNGKKEFWQIGGSNYFGTSSEKKKYPTKIQMPEELVNDGIKEVFCRRDAIFYLSNSGKLYGSGLETVLGLGKSAEGYTYSVDYLNMDGVETIHPDYVDFCEENATTINTIFLQKDGKLYMTGNSTIMYGDDVYQKNWSLVAKNVKYFIPGAYIDRDNNLWVSGESGRLGLGEQSENNIFLQNYIKNEDANIKGKAEKVYTTGVALVVLTNTKELYAAGKPDGNSVPGWGDSNPRYEFVKVLDNVEFVATGRDYRPIIAITSDGKGHGTGGNHGKVVSPSSSSIRSTFDEYDLPEEIGGVDNIKDLKIGNWLRSYLVTKDGKIFKRGIHNNGGYDGGQSLTAEFTIMTYNINLEAGEGLDGMTTMNDGNVLMWTTKGRVFGYGSAKFLGINDSTATNKETRELEITDVEQIVAGNGWYIAIKKDGTVWGTGTNNYGILGRWVGVGRDESNSRYKTALNWVECPELEI